MFVLGEIREDVKGWIMFFSTGLHSVKSGEEKREERGNGETLLETQWALLLGHTLVSSNGFFFPMLI